MQNLSSSTDSLSSLYKSLQPEEMNDLAPRAGYYLLASTYPGFIGKHQVRLAKSHWKMNLEDDFDKAFIVEIQLKSFETNANQSSTDILKGDLKGKIIFVKNANRIKAEGSVDKFIVDWEFVAQTNVEEVDEEFQLIGNIENGYDEELDLLCIINAQLNRNDDVFDAILMMEDNRYDELEETNDWIFELLAQDLPAEITAK